MAGGIGGLPSSGPEDACARRTRPTEVRGGPAVRASAGVGHAIRELPVAERPRERLAQRGPGGLTAAELIALLWGSGTRGRSAVDLAADALATHEGLTGLARRERARAGGTPRDRRGQGRPARAAFELGRRLMADWPTHRWSIRGPATSPTG